MKRIFAALTFIAFAGACAAPIESRRLLHLEPDQIAEMKAVVTHNFKDPNSAEFRGIKWFENVHEDGKVSNFACGQVNGKNSFGGFVGFRTFTGRFDGEMFVLHAIANNDTEWVISGLCPK